MERQLDQYPDIPGLYYCKNIISKEEEEEIINNINNSKWLTDLTRRVQHYGYKYDYKKRKIDKYDKIGDLPNWAKNIGDRIIALLKKHGIKLDYDSFDQLIINEYKTGQGIAPHVDCVPCFKDGIVTITIGNKGIMTFTDRNSKDTYDITLKRRSFAIFTGKSRYNWTHEINKNKNTHLNDDKPRISLTYRKCIL